MQFLAMRIFLFKNFTFIKIILVMTLSSVSFAKVCANEVYEGFYEFHIEEYKYNLYSSFLEQRPPMSYDDPSRLKGFNRTFLEYWIFEKALHLGGCECNVKIIPFPPGMTYGDKIEKVRTGEFLSDPEAGISADKLLFEEIWFTEPIISGDEFEVGFYVHSEREDLLQLTEFEDIAKLRFAVVEGWQLDRDVLAKYKFETVLAKNWEHLNRLLINGEADVVLQPFQPTDDLGYLEATTNAYFLPLKNIKLPFGFGRQYFVSKNSENGKEFLTYLNKGIRELRNSGYLTVALKNAGIIVEEAENFRVYPVPEQIEFPVN